MDTAVWVQVCIVALCLGVVYLILWAMMLEDRIRDLEQRLTEKR